MSDIKNNDHSAGRVECNCLKNSDCILSFEVKAHSGAVSFYNNDKQWEDISLEEYKYTWMQNTPTKSIQLLADEKNGRDINFLLTPKNCISESKDCPVAIMYELEDSHMMIEGNSPEYIAVKDGIIEKKQEYNFRFDTVDLKKYFEEKSNELIRNGSAVVFGTAVDNSVLKVLGQENIGEGVETILKKQLLFALAESLITGRLNSFPHTSFKINVLECNGNKGKLRTIPMREGHVGQYAGEVPEIQSSSKTQLNEAPALGFNSLSIDIDIFPVISFEYGVRGEIDVKNFVRNVQGLPRELPPPVLPTDEKTYGEEDDEDKPIFYKIYNGKDNIIDEMAFDPLEIKDDLIKFVKKVVPFASTFSILDLMVTYIKNFTPSNPRPLFGIKALPPKFVVGGHGSFRQNSEGQFYVHPYGEITTSPLMGAEVKIDMLKAMVLMIPGGKLLSYFLEVLDQTQVAFQDGNMPFYLNARADLFISPAVNLTLSYSYNEQQKKMEMSFLDNQEFELLTEFNARVDGAFILSTIYNGAFKLSFQAKFKARLGLDKKPDGSTDLVYFHDGIGLKGRFAARLYVVIFGCDTFQWTYDDDVKYRGDILKKSDSKYRVNLESGKSSAPADAPSNWYPDYVQNYQPTPQQWSNFMNMRLY